MEFKNGKLIRYKGYRKDGFNKNNAHYNIISEPYIKLRKSIEVYLKMEDYITKLWDKRGINWKE